MWISSSVSFLLGSAFVVPPTSLPFHKVRRPPEFFGNRRFQYRRNKKTMSVKDDDNTVTEQNDFCREAEVERWIQEVHASDDASIVKNLESAFHAGPESTWELLFPQTYQESLLKKDEGFATFLACAESALLSLQENGCKETTTAKSICRWIESLRGELLSNARATIAATGRNDDGDVCVDEGASEESSPEDEPKKKTLVEVESELRKLGKDNYERLATLRMDLLPRDKNEEKQCINLLYDATESVDTVKKWKAMTLSVNDGRVRRNLYKYMFLDEDNMVNSEDLRRALAKLELSPRLTKDRLEDLVEELDGAGFIRSARTMGPEELELELEHGYTRLPEPQEKYRDGLVEVSGRDRLEFDGSPEESKVVIVTGGAGSGKTTFGQYGVKRLIAKEHDGSSTGVIYVPVSRFGSKLFEQDPDTYEAADILLRMLFSQCLRNFYDKRSEEGAEDEVVKAAYRNVSKLGSKLNEKRNKAARDVFDSAMELFFSKSTTSFDFQNWWQEILDKLVLDGLVIVLDGMVGRHRLTRGLVDIARDIVDGIVRGGWCPLAKKCKIVLVGSGLEEVNEEFHMTEVTDPAKAQVVVTKRVDVTSPAFEQLLKDCDIKPEEILHGTFSSVLAENARMLIEKIVPSMTSEALTEFCDPFNEGLRTKHRIAAGSSMSFMNDAARFFIANNGLSSLSDPEDVDRVFQNAFLFFAREAIEGIVADDDADENLIAGTAASHLEELTDTENYVRIFNYGVANRGGTTSRAMKCLSCLGPAFALIDGDELRFEKALPMHLARLSTSQGRKQAGTHELQTAVPDEDRAINLKELKDDVSKIRSMFPDKKKDIRDEGPWSLILTQCAEKTAGPDTMELQFHVKGYRMRGSLDIYQHSFGEEAYQVANLLTAAIQLGRSPEDLGLLNESTSNDTTNAKKVSDYLDEFVKLLGEEFGIKITIRKRVIVVKQSASELEESMETVLKGDVTVWTSEFLEPTYSLFLPSL